MQADVTVRNNGQRAASATTGAGFFRSPWKRIAILGATLATAGALYYGVPACIDKANDDRIRPKAELLIRQADSLTKGQKIPSFEDCREFLEIGAQHNLSAGDMLALMELRDTVNMRGSTIGSLREAFDGERLTLKRIYQTLRLFPRWLRRAPGGSGAEYEKNMAAYLREIDREFGRVTSGHEGNGEKKEARRYVRMREVVKAAVVLLPKSEFGAGLQSRTMQD